MKDRIALPFLLPVASATVVAAVAISLGVIFINGGNSLAIIVGSAIALLVPMIATALAIRK